MTREEFNNHGFSCNTKFKYEGEVYPVKAVSFKEGLLGLDIYDDADDLSWVRCESGSIEP